MIGYGSESALDDFGGWGCWWGQFECAVSKGGLVKVSTGVVPQVEVSMGGWRIGWRVGLGGGEMEG